jgi:transposase
MAYCEKYRKAAVEYKDSGHTFVELREAFKVSSSTYYKWLRYKKEFGCYVPPCTGKQKRRGKIDPDKLMEAVKESPDAYLRELAAIFNCSVNAIHKRLKDQKLTLKKRRLRIQRKAKSKESNTTSR